LLNSWLGSQASPDPKWTQATAGTSKQPGIKTIAKVFDLKIQSVKPLKLGTWPNGPQKLLASQKFQPHKSANKTAPVFT
jgi:hypothetical protein